MAKTEKGFKYIYYKNGKRVSVNATNLFHLLHISKSFVPLFALQMFSMLHANDQNYGGDINEQLYVLYRIGEKEQLYIKEVLAAKEKNE